MMWLYWAIVISKKSNAHGWTYNPELRTPNPKFKSKCQSYGPALWIKVETPNPILFKSQMLCLHTYKKKHSIPSSGTTYDAALRIKL